MRELPSQKKLCKGLATITQLVEFQISNLGVARSSRAGRSKTKEADMLIDVPKTEGEIFDRIESVANRTKCFLALRQDDELIEERDDRLNGILEEQYQEGLRELEVLVTQLRGLFARWKENQDRVAAQPEPDGELSSVGRAQS